MKPSRIGSRTMLQININGLGELLHFGSNASVTVAMIETFFLSAKRGDIWKFASTSSKQIEMTRSLLASMISMVSNKIITRFVVLRLIKKMVLA
jgi:hypothetical protein